MYHVIFNANTVLTFDNLKSAYKSFVSNSRFFINKNLEKYCVGSVFNNDKRVFEWVYCQEISSGDEIDDDLVYCNTPMYFFSKEV